MSKFQPPVLNEDVCRAATEKQTHIYTNKKHTYIKRRASYHDYELLSTYILDAQLVLGMTYNEDVPPGRGRLAVRSSLNVNTDRDSTYNVHGRRRMYGDVGGCRWM